MMSKKIRFISRKTKDNLKKYIKKIFEIINRPEMSILPGQLAFYMILSAVPIVTLCAYGLSFFDITSDTIVTTIDDVVPGGISFLSPILNGSSIDLKLTLFLIWMFYIASNGFNSVILVTNQIYGISQSNWFKRRLKAILMTFTFVLMLIIILLVPVFGNKILNLVLDGDVSNKINLIYAYVKGPISWAIMFIFIRTIYEFAPDRMRRKTHINTGAFFTSIGWIIVTLIYSHLANNMTNYNILYGALSSIAFLMIWLYFMSYIFVMGLSLNYGEEVDKEEKERVEIPALKPSNEK